MDSSNNSLVLRDIIMVLPRTIHPLTLFDRRQADRQERDIQVRDGRTSCIEESIAEIESRCVAEEIADLSRLKRHAIGNPARQKHQRTQNQKYGTIDVRRF